MDMYIGGDPKDLTIAHGRIYVDGLLVENDADTTLATQPLLHWNQAGLSTTGVTGAGLYGVYLDAWERLVTAIDDPSLGKSLAVLAAIGPPFASSTRSSLLRESIGSAKTTLTIVGARWTKAFAAGSERTKAA